jgi:hypothetical protein
MMQIKRRRTQRIFFVTRSPDFEGRRVDCLVFTQALGDFPTGFAPFYDIYRALPSVASR